MSDYVVEGTDTTTLRKGPGHYPDTPLPGGPGTTAIAGHRTTYGAPFRSIDDLRRGDRIVVDMPDGRFVYRVERIKIVDDQDLSVLEPVGHKRLMLSACHPLYSAAERVIVFARQVRRERLAGQASLSPRSPASTEDWSRDSRKRIRPTTSASEMATTASQ